LRGRTKKTKRHSKVAVPGHGIQELEKLGVRTIDGLSTLLQDQKKTGGKYSTTKVIRGYSKGGVRKSYNPKKKKRGSALIFEDKIQGGGQFQGEKVMTGEAQ